MIALMSEKVGILEERLSMILRFAPLEDSASEKDQDVDGSLAPAQHQVMAQYMRLNQLCGRLDDITRRVQL
jgi:hypothetical protein